MNPRTSPARIATIDFDLGTITGFSAELISTKRVTAGQAVSYGGEYVTDRETVLGLVAAGYAEGIPRSAQGAPVTIDGRRFAISGRVAMDQLVVDLGPDAEIAPGALAHFWGEAGTPIQEWASAVGVPRGALEHFLGPRTSVSLTVDVADAAAMEALGAAFAAGLTAGDAIILTGELGAGKTTFTRGLASALGARGTVQSPTFVIARTHETETVPLLHVDAYRLGAHRSGDEELIDDLDLDLEGSITVAEWGEPLTHAMDAWFDVRIHRAQGAETDPLDPDTDDPRSVTILQGGTLRRDRLLALLEK
ncbi:tRNA (adenosine(37)-N6)-threonylcarbamoyltransferase complex ATPase subunit type 1 TsaE [uncultured Agrococcus sp.]|uniref:tRNA (adenosine(37)-N6)-threonylcarbamoyltransferase complex ATPase subunit type 1 TsaE n=1 Tax=uncultured Agrococcus sp. TaxID=382258 RepID=UPI0025E576F2|nr:tRNA (adenosine(37)-N6)-threonylcarbamoyltransferase complex ATPase subunit type 1 TsaE [uncultured Agrococcus sp.]